MPEQKAKRSAPHCQVGAVRRINFVPTLWLSCRCHPTRHDTSVCLWNNFNTFHRNQIMVLRGGVRMLLLGCGRHNCGCWRSCKQGERNHYILFKSFSPTAPPIDAGCLCHSHFSYLPHAQHFYLRFLILDFGFQYSVLGSPAAVPFSIFVGVNLAKSYAPQLCLGSTRTVTLRSCLLRLPLCEPRPQQSQPASPATPNPNPCQTRTNGMNTQARTAYTPMGDECMPWHEHE